MSSLTLCEQEEESPELSELRELIEEFDWLFECCMTQPLSEQDQATLDSLYFELMLREGTFWEGASSYLVKMFNVMTDLDFPMIRYKLDMLPKR